MKKSPFIYGTTVSTRSFTNREREAEKLRSNLLNGLNTMIISPRRWGKSSLVEKVIHDISKEKGIIRIVLLDLFSVSNEEEFLEIFAREVIKASSTRWEEWMNSGKEFFKSLVPTLSVGVDPNTDFKLSFDRKELKKHRDEVLNLPEAIAQKKSLRYIICLDEFQSLSSFADYPSIEKAMRAVWQRQKKVAYCLYGSKRHMMADIFNNPAKPFYRFGDIMLLPKIETGKWITFIRKGFMNSGKQITEADAALIPELMKNNSWYVQQLSHYTWSQTEKKAGKAEIKKALDELIYANTPLYQRDTENMSITQLNLLKAVAGNEIQFTSTEVMQRYQLGTPNNVLKNKAMLIYKDIIQETGSHFEFVDPAFELWFKRQFLGEPYGV